MKDYKLNHFKQQINAILQNSSASKPAVVCGLNKDLIQFVLDYLKQAYDYTEISDKKLTDIELGEVIGSLDLFGNSDRFVISNLAAFTYKKKIINFIVEARPANLIVGYHSPKMNKDFEKIIQQKMGVFCPKSFAYPELLKILCSMYSLDISQQVQQKLLTLCGEDVYPLSQELLKIKDLKEAFQVKDGDLEKFLIGPSKYQVFDVEKYIMESRGDRALTAATALVDAGVSQLVVLAIVAKLMRKMLRLKEGIDTDISFLPDFIKQRYIRFSRQYSEQVFADALGMCQNIDYGIKSNKTEFFTEFSRLFHHFVGAK